MQPVYSTTQADWATIDKTLSGAITPGQSGSESDGNEGVLCIPQISSDISGHSLEESYLYTVHPHIYIYIYTHTHTHTQSIEEECNSSVE